MSLLVTWLILVYVCVSGLIFLIFMDDGERFDDIAHIVFWWLLIVVKYIGTHLVKGLWKVLSTDWG
jgi:hypothetical protein